MKNINNNNCNNSKWSTLLAFVAIVVITIITLVPTINIVSRQIIHAKQLAKIETLSKTNSQFITLTFTPQQYAQLSIDDNELEYNGKMYDIKSSTTTNANTTLTLLPDSRETYVIALFKHLASNNNEQLTASNLFLFYYYESISGIQLKPIITTPLSTMAVVYMYIYVNPSHKNTTPPPQLLS